MKHYRSSVLNMRPVGWNFDLNLSTEAWVGRPFEASSRNLTVVDRGPMGVLIHTYSSHGRDLVILRERPHL